MVASFGNEELQNNTADVPFNSFFKITVIYLFLTVYKYGLLMEGHLSVQMGTEKRDIEQRKYENSRN